jgi:hypothetical protein
MIIIKVDIGKGHKVHFTFVVHSYQTHCQIAFKRNITLTNVNTLQPFKIDIPMLMQIVNQKHPFCERY